MAEALETPHDALGRFFVVESRLRIELIGIADHLFLWGLRQVSWQTGTRMALCHTGMLRQPLLAKYPSAYSPVFHIGMLTTTKYAWRIGLDNAYVVKHGGFPKELAVETEFGMPFANGHTTLGHLTAMTQQYGLQLGLTGVILMDKRLSVHRSRYQYLAATVYV